MVLGSRHLGYSEAQTREGFDNTTPGGHTQIMVDRQQNLARVQEYIAIAHELAHGCSVWHHGDDDPRTKQLQSHITLGLGVDSTINGVPIYLHDENDLPLNRPFSSPKIYAAILNGQHSGNQDCIMRYEAARLFTHKTFSTRTNEFTGEVSTRPVFYYIATPETNARSHLCENGIGTGINVPLAGTVRPRHGHAAPKRGNCKGQICVNDEYVGSIDHVR
jgi:hypothetical protein